MNKSGESNSPHGQVQALLSRGREEEALDLLRATLPRILDDEDALLECGDLLVKTGNWEDALLYWNALAILAPHRPRTIARKAGALRALHKLKESDALLSDELVRNPHHPVLLAQQARNLMSARRWKEALETWDGILASSPSFKNAQRGRSTVMQHLNGTRNELSSLEQALKRAPRDGDLLARAAEASMTDGALADATDYWQRLTNWHPNNERGWIGLARAAIELSAPHRVRSAIDEGLRYCPDSHQLRAMRTECTKSTRD